MPAQLYPAEHADALKAWLTDSLAGICDADPAVLSDYVLALIRHDLSGDELKTFIAEQLEDFLAEGTGPFVDQLFEALRTQSYLPAAAAPAVPAPADFGAAAGDASGSRKRRAESPASSSPAPMTGAVSSNKAMRSSDGPSSAPGSAPREMRERTGRDGRPKEMCRDYHNKGFCSRGDACRYDHSGAVVAGPGPGGMGPAGFPQGPMMGAPMRFGGPSGPQGGFQGMHGMQGMQGQQFGMPPQQQQQQQQQGGPWGPGPMQQQGMPHPGAFGAAGPSLGSRMGPQGQQQPGFQGGPPHDGQFHGMSGPSRGGHAAGRGAHNATPRGAFRGARSQTALVLENVPAEHLELIKINEYFKRFGTITNIQIDAPGQKALVDFARPEEAKAAHGCPDAVFGNRFVRIFFQRLEDAENGGISTPLDKPGAPHQSRPIAKKPAFVPGQTNVYHAPGAPTTAASRAKVELDRKQAQSQLDHLLGEQKTLMASVTSSSITPDARKATMMRLRALPAEIGAATDKVKEAVQAIANMPAAPAPLSTEERNALKERRERERLDRELEMHGKGDETTDELKAKLESLKAEAASLGLDANGAPSSYRGAPRGRGARGTSFRGSYYNRGGRGGAASMRLDNRTTRLVVSDVPAAEMGTTKEYFKTLGEVSDIADSSSAAFIVNYKTRATGETAMRMGGEVPGVGKVKLAWAAVDVPMGGSSPSSGNGSAGGMKEEEADAPMKEEEENWIP